MPEGGQDLAALMKSLQKAVDTFNNWMMGDLEMVVESIKGNTVKLLIRQNCACSLDFSLKEEIENAFKAAGLKAKAEIQGWDVERSGYMATVEIQD
ncbi:MAG: hypothetical protein F7C09_01070 [Aeropyrum sp.]|nr:hypothetical protein [Aeropyrum sp.]